MQDELLRVSTVFVSSHEFGEKCKVRLQSQIMVCWIWTAIIYTKKHIYHILVGSGLMDTHATVRLLH